jgi:hypothetical protein
VAALAAVARGDDGLAPFAPGRDHALDRVGREVGPVGEHDEGGLRVERGQAAAKGGSGALLPVGAADDARVGLDVVRAEDDDDVLDCGAPEPVQDLWEKEALLRGAEARGGARRKDDGRDQVQPRSERQAAVTFAT